MDNKNNKIKHVVPIWQKVNLTIGEAALLFNIGTNKLMDLTNKNNCDFVIFNGTKRIINRRKFEEFCERTRVL